MKTEEQIRKKLEQQRAYLKHADTRYDYTQEEVIEKVIEELEWVLK